MRYKTYLVALLLLSNFLSMASCSVDKSSLDRIDSPYIDIEDAQKLQKIVAADIVLFSKWMNLPRQKENFKYWKSHIPILKKVSSVLKNTSQLPTSEVVKAYKEAANMQYGREVIVKEQLLRMDFFSFKGRVKNGKIHYMRLAEIFEAAAQAAQEGDYEEATKQAGIIKKMVAFMKPRSY